MSKKKLKSVKIVTFSYWIFPKEWPFQLTYVTFGAVWYYFYNLKNVKNTHGGVLLFTKNN